MRIRLLCLPLFAFLSLLAACYGELPPLDLKGSLKVEFVTKLTTGTSADKLRKVSVAGEIFKMKITALDSNGQLNKSYNGKVCFYASRGVLVSPITPTTLQNGQATREVQLKLGFGRTTVWAAETDAKATSCTAERPTINMAGSAPAIYYENLSISDIQTNPDFPFDSPLRRKYSVITQGKMVVTATTSNGFFLTDMDAYKKDPTGGYHSLFIFTFSAPSVVIEDGVPPRLLNLGEIVHRVEGGVDEFTGHTQITFPSFEPDWVKEKNGPIKRVAAKEMPAPIPLSIDALWDSEKMEPLESALVKVTNGITVPFPDEQSGWSEFRQWPVLLFKPKDESKRTECENKVLEELHLKGKVDPQKLTYVNKLGDCQKARESEEARRCANKKDKDLEACMNSARSNFRRCVTNERRAMEQRHAALCSFGMILVVSNATVPRYNPLEPTNHFKRIPKIVGVLVQSTASAYYQLRKDQYRDEKTNNGYLLRVRCPKDLQRDKASNELCYGFDK